MRGIGLLQGTECIPPRWIRESPSEGGALVPQTNLKPESGAEFFGKIEYLYEEQLFRASCYAQIQHSAERDAPKFWMCGTQAAAEKWIEVQAALRGFPKYTVLRGAEAADWRAFSAPWEELAPLR